MRFEEILRRGDPRSSADWTRRLDADRTAAHESQSRDQRAITASLLERVRDGGGIGFALTGSTVRHRRTPISDLDYHVVGRRPLVDDMPSDVDVFAVSPERTWARLRAGDDFVQWTLRCGHVLWDTGVFRALAAAIVEGDLWPDGAAKLARIPELRALGARLVAMGDRDAGQDQVRAALTSAARGILLLEDVFPLARIELPEQLIGVGMDDMAHALERSISGCPSLEELAEDLRLVDERALSARP